MQFRYRTLLSFTTLLLSSAFCSAAELSAANKAEKNAALQTLFADYDKAQLAQSPLSKASRGIKDQDYGKWGDFSEAAAALSEATNRTALEKMRAQFDPAELDDNNRLSYRLFVSRIERSTAAYRYRDHSYVFDQMSGAQSNLPAFLINIHRVDNKSDAEAYISRLHGLGPVFDQLIVRSRSAAEKGLLPPKWVYPYIIDDARNVIAGAPFTAGANDAPLLADFKQKIAKLSLPAADKAALEDAAALALRSSVQPAYERLIAEMTRQEKIAPTIDGVWRFPNGASYYAERLSNYTTTTLTPEQIHSLGLAQVARIHGEVRDIMKQVNFKGDLPAFFTFMRTDPRFSAPNTDEGRALYLSETEKAKQAVTALLPTWFGVLPQSPMMVKRVEPFREKSAGKAFYQRPSPDGSRPGTYYANLYDMADMPLTEVEALFYHEGIPGHHLQLAIQTELKDVPNFRKFGGVTAYSEGWGLYAEKLAKDMGLYTDPYRDFGRLQLELHRAIRLVVDSGLHYKKWSREQAIQYVADNSADAPGGIVKAIERYIVTPGQATAYMVGRLKITDLRSKAQTALGSRFDIRGFHDVILRSGPVPLDIMEERVDAWIAAKNSELVAPQTK